MTNINEKFKILDKTGTGKNAPNSKPSLQTSPW